jgi:hypothetical protein
VTGDSKFITYYLSPNLSESGFTGFKDLQDGMIFRFLIEMMMNIISSVNLKILELVRIRISRISGFTG